MSNRTDFKNVASELVEMFGLDPDLENPNTGKLRWRIERELHNAFVAGQEGGPSGADSRLAMMAATIAAGTEAGLEPSDSWGSAEDVARRAVCVAREILAELERENVGPR